MGNSYTQDNRIAPNVVPFHSFYGEPDTAIMRPDSHGSNVAPATWSTAPYRPPARRDGDNPDLKLCAFEDCRAYPSEKAGGDYCMGHARQLGMVPTCAKPDCKSSPKPSSGYCRWHEPKAAADGDTG